MTPDNPNFNIVHEAPSSANFEQALQKLSTTPENLVKISPEDIGIAAIRKSFSESGCNLAISETERASLLDTQFRDLDSGRGIGVKAVLGEDRAQVIIAKIPEIAEGRGKVGGKEGTEGRGLRQFVADTIKLITTENPTKEDVQAYCKKLNERVFKGYKKALEYKKDEKYQIDIAKAFDGVEDKTDIGTFSSIPPQSLDKVWKLMLGQ
jgi:hypothetical protein